MNNKIITIFGGTGFIGKYVVQELIRAGYTIRVVSRSFQRAKLLKTGAFVGQVVPIVGDLKNPEDFPKLVEGSYAVINLVGLLYQSGSQRFNTIHNLAAEKLAVAAKKAGAERFVHVSAIVPDESNSKYAESKLAGERAVQNAFPDAVILKPSVVFGAEDNFFNQFARIASIAPFLPLIGGGRTKFQPVYVGDVAKAIFAGVENARPGIYQLGGPQVMTFREILEQILLYTNRRNLLISLPFFFAKFISHFLPPVILTADQIELLKHDNVVSGRAKGFKELGIIPEAIQGIVPDYITRFAKRTPQPYA